MNHKNEFSLIFLLLLTILIFLSVYFMFFRIVDADEGYHLFASRALHSGEMPYRDFYFVQMPLILYILFPFSVRGFNGFLAARSIYAILSIGLGILLFYYVLRRTEDEKTALVCFALYIFNGFILSWHSVLQFNALTDIALFLSFLLILRKRDTSLFLSGLFLGIVINLRLVFAPLVILFFIWLLLNRPRKRSSLIFLLGCLVSFSFSLYFLFMYRGIFFFDVFYSQIARTTLFLPVSNPFMQKITVLAKFFGFPQTGGIVVLSILTLFHFKRKFISFKPELLAFLTGITIFFTYLFATPSIFHYFVQTLPFLLVASLPYVKYQLNRRSRFVYILAIIYGFFITIPVGLHVFGVRKSDKMWRMDNIKKVVEYIVKNTEADDKIIAFWDGFSVLSKRKEVSDIYINPWEKSISEKLSGEVKEKYSIFSDVELEKNIKAGNATLIVGSLDSEEEIDWGIADKYFKVKEFDGFNIYKRK